MNRYLINDGGSYFEVTAKSESNALRNARRIAGYPTRCFVSRKEEDGDIRCIVEDAFEAEHGCTGVSAHLDEETQSWVVWEPEAGAYWLANQMGEDWTFAEVG